MCFAGRWHQRAATCYSQWQAEPTSTTTVKLDRITPDITLKVKQRSVRFQKISRYILYDICTKVATKVSRLNLWLLIWVISLCMVVLDHLSTGVFTCFPRLCFYFESGLPLVMLAVLTRVYLERFLLQKWWRHLLNPSHLASSPESELCLFHSTSTGRKPFGVLTRRLIDLEVTEVGKRK